MKILKNTENVSYLHTNSGIGFPAGQYVTIDESDVYRLADSATLVRLGNGKFIFNDGSADITDSAQAWSALCGEGQLFQVDEEKAQNVRIKAAPKGWTFQIRGIEFETSVLSSVINEDQAGTNIGDASIKFYKTVDNTFVLITGDDLNQNFLDNNCTKTVVSVEPSYAYEIIGGYVKLKTQPNSRVPLYVVAVPDIPAPTGSKVMVQNINLEYLTPADKVEADGRASKRMNPDATYHTNKLDVVLRHNAGIKVKLLLALEHFKA